jgi:hypothetical protein
MSPDGGFKFLVAGSGTSSFQRKFLNTIPLDELDLVFPCLTSTDGFYQHLPPMFDRIVEAELVYLRHDVMVSISKRDMVVFLDLLWSSPAFNEMTNGDRHHVVHRMLDFAASRGAHNVVRYILAFDFEYNNAIYPMEIGDQLMTIEPAACNIYDALVQCDCVMVEMLTRHMVEAGTLRETVTEYPSDTTLVYIFQHKSPALTDLFCQCMLDFDEYLDIVHVMAYFFECEHSIASQIMAILKAFHHIHPNYRHPFYWTLGAIRDMHKDLKHCGSPCPWSALVVSHIRY